MKRMTFIIVSLCLLCSCGATKDTGTPQINEDISISEYVGSTEEVPYESLIDEEHFKASYESYIDDNNPLQLKNGPYKEAAVAKPFKLALVDDNEIIAPLNIWMYPVINEGKYIGFINCDLRYLIKKDAPSFFGGEMFAPKINEALENGNIALFATIKGTYGMFEDNSIIMLDATEEYTGSLAFDEINQGYNLITPESANAIIYK